MKLNEIWDNYTARMAEVELMERAIRKNFNDVVYDISEISKNSEIDKSKRFTINNMIYNNIVDGKALRYRQTYHSFSEYAFQKLVEKNKQYQWLLVESYEEYSDYLNKVYAYCGYNDNDFWLLGHYGDITMQKVQEKDYQWFLRQARRIRGGDKHIISILRDRFPEIKSVECNNCHKINYAFVISMIKQFRNVIAHTGGRVLDINLLMERIKNNLYDKNVMSEDVVLENIGAIVGYGIYNYNATKHVNSDLIIHINDVRNYINYMVGYANYIKQSVDKLL